MVAEGMHFQEAEHFPQVSEHRRHLAENYDPDGKLRISDSSKAWSLANSKGYCSTPHNESNYEVVLFTSDGKMDPRSWVFVIAGVAFELPTCGELEAFLWTAPWVWHGTLPYCGSTPHVGVGATVSNNESVKKRIDGQKGRTHTPIQNCAGFLFSKRFAADFPCMETGGSLPIGKPKKRKRKYQNSSDESDSYSLGSDEESEQDLVLPSEGKTVVPQEQVYRKLCRRRWL